MGKLKANGENANDIIASVDLPEGWFETLIQDDHLDVLLAELANQGRITNAAFKRARLSLPSFAETKWFELAPQFGLRKSIARSQPPTFTTPVYLLPPSFHVDSVTPAWRTLDVHGEIQHEFREEAPMRILDPYIVPILALFQGRIIDLPEEPMMETQYSSGGSVEHEIIMVGGILFFVIELKLRESGGDNLAQLFLELLSAAEENSTEDFAHLRVYGLLTNLTKFGFYSYDPAKKMFFLDEEFNLETRRNHYCFGMIHVANKIFSVIMHGYVEGLGAMASKSQERGDEGDTVPPGSSPFEGMQQQPASSSGRTDSVQRRSVTGAGRESTSKWEHALMFAKESLSIFQRPFRCIEDIEKNGKEALESLAKSVHVIPRFSKFTGSDQDTSLDKLSALALELVNRWYEKKLEKPHENPLYLYA